jgi:hypothetical protein
MLELPMNKMLPGAGIFFLSAASSRAMDFFQRDES